MRKLFENPKIPQIDSIQELAKAKGISYDSLIREWVLERIHHL